MLMSPDKAETAVHDRHCPGDKAVRMSKVLTKPWVGVCVSLALIVSDIMTTTDNIQNFSPSHDTA